MGRGYQPQGVLSIEELGLSWDEVQGWPLEELARQGAQIVLGSYLAREVEEHVGAAAYERTEARRGYRNGARERKLRLGAGEIELAFPKVRDTEAPFESRILGRFQRASERWTALMPALYVAGLSTRDFKGALRPLWDGSGLSRSSVSRANQEIRDGFEAWRRQDLSEVELLYLFLDGYYLGVRRGSRQKEAILVAHGFTKDGKRVLVGVYLGVRESTASWKLVLEDLTRRGLRPPALVVTDGNGGVIRALGEAEGWAEVPRQRCLVHRNRNVLERVPKSRHTEVRRALARIWYAPGLAEALAAAKSFAAKYGSVFPAAVEVLGQDLANCLTFFRFPARHWKRLRTANPLERAFREVRRRTDVVGRFPNERSALSLVAAVLLGKSGTWHGLRLRQGEAEAARGAVLSLREQPIVVRGFEEIAA